MDVANWIAIGVCAFTTINGWAQFYIKERIFSKADTSTDKIINLLKTRAGISFIALTGALSVVSVLALIVITSSEEPLTRLACFQISLFTALTLLNFILVQSLFTLRKLASLAQEIKKSENRSRAFAFFIGQ